MYSVVIADTEPLDLIRTENYLLASGLPLQIEGRFGDGLLLHDHIRAHRTDIVITSVNLPGRRGLDVARDIAGTRPGCLFILMSPFSEFSYEHARTALEVGAVSYLLKPLDPEILIGTLTKAVDRLAADPAQQEPLSHHPAPVSSMSSESALLADRIYNHITEHFEQPLSIADIKTRFAVSESYINKLLIRYKGKSFVKILTQVRISQAWRMIQQYPDMPIQDIAYAVGYNDPHYFSRIYKAMTGVAPSMEKKEKTDEVYGYGKR